MINPVTPAKSKNGDILRGVNWNDIRDPLDKQIWDRMTTNFWIPEKFPVSNDKQGWSQMTDAEQSAVLRVFTGLTLLDTIQGTCGAVEMIRDAETQHEEANFTFIAAMESIHARSYSNIFMTLSSTPDIDAAFRWSHENAQLQYKANRIMSFYRDGDPLRKKIASVMLESFLFFSGFYVALRFSSIGKITNTADIIRMILTDESLHGYYIGAKAQHAMRGLPLVERDELHGEIVDLLLDLYENEVKYTEDIYDDLGWAEDVKAYLRLNANKAMNNLGLDGLFPADETKCHPAVRTALDPSKSENHDFFGGSGSSYVIGEVEETTDDDWGFGNE